MQTGMNIGTVVDPDSLGALTDALVRILEVRADQQTLCHAIDALARMAKVDGVTIQNCVINGDRSVVVDVDAENGTAEIRHTPSSY